MATYRTDITAELNRIDRIARIMDARFSLPGIRFRFGLDSILGLVPVAGDVLTVIPSLWMINRARRLGAPRWLLVRMIGNTSLDFAIGSVPIIGDAFDAVYKANLRNACLLRRHLEDRLEREGDRSGDSGRIAPLHEVRRWRRAAFAHVAPRRIQTQRIDATSSDR